MSGPVEGLMKLGFTEYEARAYVAIVSIGEGGINEIGIESSIPRSRVYDIMERLAAKGVVEVGAFKPLRYKAIDPERAIREIKLDLTRTADIVIDELKEMRKGSEKTSTPLWFIIDERIIPLEVKDLILRARESVKILAMTNGILLKSANVIAEKSKDIEIDVVVLHEPEGFEGLLGRSTLYRLKDEGSIHMRWWEALDFPEEWEERIKTELLITSDHGSLFVYKENDVRRAIKLDGSIIELFLQSVMNGILKNSEPLGKITRK